MSLIVAEQLALSFGALDVFRGVSVSVPPGGKIGLVGPNGAGKTSLLRMLAGQAQPSAGRVTRARGIRIGYLRQEAAEAFADSTRSVFDEMLAVFEALRAEEQRMRALEAEIGAGGADAETLARYGQLQERFALAGGYDYELRIRQVLTGLGFGPERWEQPLDQLSGGQKTRALLARLLLEAPDLLVLDEPTNHLDVEAVAWLEGLLAGWEGAVLVVSHDRYFLDRVAGTIWELGPEGIEAFRGNYSAYVLQREERWRRRRKAYDAMMERFAKELDYVRRNIAGQRTQQARGKLSRLAREVEAVHAAGPQVLQTIQSKGWLQATADLDMERPSDRVEGVAQRIGALRPPDGGTPEIHLRLATAGRGGDFVLRGSGLVVGYPGTPLFEAEDFALMRGERAALIGGNGSGKTSFLRTILGQLAPLAGELKMGGGQVIATFEQAHEGLDLSQTLLDELMRQTDLKPGEARAWLARFLFRDDDVYKRVSALSGGERGRLALAILALEPANFLLLDEPTNHLDIPAQEILQAAIERFPGTVLLVSHDRYLVDRLATCIWSLEEGRLRVFGGPYQEFLAARQAQREARRAARDAARDAGRKEPAPGAGSDRNGGGQGAAPALSKNERKRRGDEAARLEARIAELEAELARLASALQSAGEAGDYEAIGRLDAEHARLQAAIDDHLARWDALTAELAAPDER